MLRILYPDMYVPAVTEIQPSKLWEIGIRNILIDLDNTIVPRDCEYFSPEIKTWIDNLLDKGFKLCIVSNNSTTRVNNLARQMRVPCVERAVKPLRRAFLRGMHILGARPENTAVIGDQLFTDILGGNRLGLYTILVVPLPGKEFWGTRIINRPLEKIVLYKILRRVPHKDKQYIVK